MKTIKKIFKHCMYICLLLYTCLATYQVVLITLKFLKQGMDVVNVLGAYLIVQSFIILLFYIVVDGYKKDMFNKK